MKTRVNVSDWTRRTLAQALTKLDVPNGQKVVADALEGETPSQLEEFFRKLGFSVLAGEMLLEDLDHFVNQGWPVIAGLSDRLVLLDNIGERVFFHDPDEGSTEDPVSAFMARWNGFGRTQYGITIRLE